MVQLRKTDGEGSTSPLRVKEGAASRAFEHTNYTYLSSFCICFLVTICEESLLKKSIRISGKGISIRVPHKYK